MSVRPARSGVPALIAGLLLLAVALTGCGGTRSDAAPGPKPAAATTSASARPEPVSKKGLAQAQADMKFAAFAADMDGRAHPGAVTLRGMKRAGYRPWPGMSTAVRNHGSAYCLRVTSPAAHLPAGQGVWWDSRVGAAVVGSQPKTATCGRVTF